MLEARFRADFDRCFARVWRFVQARTRSREDTEQVVRRVLEENLDCFLELRSEREEAARLLASARRLLGELRL